MIDQSIFLRALRKENNEVPPIWYMRQAGRYLPEYRAVRSKFKNFLDMCKDPDVCCELALQPIDRFNLDASILFSDILTIPDAFNLGVEFGQILVVILAIVILYMLGKSSLIKYKDYLFNFTAIILIALGTFWFIGRAFNLQ